LLFVESYGRTFIDSERFAQRAAVTLDKFDTHLSDAGLHSTSGWLDSPVRGGRSWLVHATLASGLPLTNHARFDRLMASDRRPLWSLFEAAGWESAVVLPAVHDRWTESTWYSVDRFFNAPSLGYQGKDFGYVTMPDQYTLSAFEHQVRRTATRPLAAERSLELTMDTIGEYLARYADDGLFIVVGDHQPASIIDGWAPNAHVPVHFVSKRRDVLERLPSANFTNGVTPDAEAPALSMADVRLLLTTRFSN
jgi:hypothetical protein